MLSRMLLAFDVAELFVEKLFADEEFWLFFMEFIIFMIVDMSGISPTNSPPKLY